MRQDIREAAETLRGMADKLDGIAGMIGLPIQGPVDLLEAAQKLKLAFGEDTYASISFDLALHKDRNEVVWRVYADGRIATGPTLAAALSGALEKQRGKDDLADVQAAFTGAQDPFAVGS